MSADVGRYYDENTGRFLARGQGRATGSIHRAVWGPGVSTRDEAFHFVHELVRREIAATGARRILDLGCGVGSSLAYLLARCDVEAFGITASAVQAELAPPSLSLRLGDFCRDELPSPVDVAYAIESFVHASDAGAFFERVGRALGRGGRLAICDDFLAGSPGDYWVREFRSGWHIPSLLPMEKVDRLAEEQGLLFLSDLDLTPFLEIDRPRDRAIRLLVAFTRSSQPKSPGFQALRGGNALRQCLKRGLVKYRFRVYEKRGIT
ncbi:MAG TPA: methyltransferase domain-containing protein [Vicinamibacteria bacterium]|nr:methyltransferase domain-containing protein [Vicinamibacteria bacterium]